MPHTPKLFVRVRWLRLCIRRVCVREKRWVTRGLRNHSFLLLAALVLGMPLMTKSLSIALGSNSALAFFLATKSLAFFGASLSFAPCFSQQSGELKKKSI